MLPFHFEKILSGKTIFVTGHTGFTGSWACLWLLLLGARVKGFALPPATDPSLFTATKLNEKVDTVYGDVRDFSSLERALRQAKPDYVLHLAAQPLVGRSYREPRETFDINVMGTANLLESVRRIDTVSAVVCVTTDKVYKNNEWPWAYRENDAIGGHDPYSASKAAAEMVIAGYRGSFFSAAESGSPAIHAARGGNIIGGGDWAECRLIPDYVRAVVSKSPLFIRYPDAVRPWQHVLALVQGYLALLAGAGGKSAGESWNFGPTDSRKFRVRDILDLLAVNWQRIDVVLSEEKPVESSLLVLDSSLARERLGWEPVWNTERTVAETIAWYRDYYTEPRGAEDITVAQINSWRAGTAQ